MSEENKISWAKEPTGEANEKSKEPTIIQAVAYLADQLNKGLLEVAQAIREIRLQPPRDVKVEPKKKREPEPQKRVVDSRTVSDMFPDNYRELLTFEEVGEYTIVRPKRFLGSETFANVGRIVRELGGRYISMGKQSHFKIPKE